MNILSDEKISSEYIKVFRDQDIGVDDPFTEDPEMGVALVAIARAAEDEILRQVVEKLDILYAERDSMGLEWFIAELRASISNPLERRE